MYICITTRSLQYPDRCRFQKAKDGRKVNMNLPTPNSLHTCGVSSAVHIHVIRKGLEARRATALHVETNIICGFLLALRRLLPERSRGTTRA